MLVRVSRQIGVIAFSAAQDICAALRYDNRRRIYLTQREKGDVCQRTAVILAACGSGYGVGYSPVSIRSHFCQCASTRGGAAVACGAGVGAALATGAAGSCQFTRKTVSPE